MSEMSFDHDAIVTIFAAESEDHLNELEQGFVDLESSPGDVEVLQAVFRAAHTLKGNAAGLGFEELARLAHVLEDSLDRLREGRLQYSTTLATALLGTVDALRTLLRCALEGTSVPPSTVRASVDALTTASSGAEPPSADGAAAHPGDAPPDQSDTGAKAQTLRVEVRKLDRILDLTGEITVARGRLSALLESDEAQTSTDAIVEAHRVADRLLLSLQEEVMKVRMVPLGPTFRQLRRTVRDVTHALGTLATLEIAGDEVEVDLTAIELLRDPLTHLVRNALVHGIERPADRVAAGKEAHGRLLLHAWHEGGSIVVEVQDDGRGLDRAKILARATELGLGADVERMPDRQLFQLIFEHGFSTSDGVTQYAGRGVGMDVVRRNVERLRGTIGIESKSGFGTSFTIRLPLTLAIVQGFAVAAGGETYIVPLEQVVECVASPEHAPDAGPATGLMTLRGHGVPYVRLRRVFGLAAPSVGHEHVLVVHHQGRTAGLVVDDLLGETQTVIKPLGRFIGYLPGVSGSAILGTGRLALVLDVEELLRDASRTAGDRPRNDLSAIHERKTE